MAKVAPNTDPAATDAPLPTAQSETPENDHALALAGSTLASTAASLSQALTSPLDALAQPEQQAPFATSTTPPGETSVPVAESVSNVSEPTKAESLSVPSQENLPCAPTQAEPNGSAPAEIKIEAHAKAEPDVTAETEITAEAGVGAEADEAQATDVKAEAVPNAEQNADTEPKTESAVVTDIGAAADSKPSGTDSSVPNSTNSSTPARAETEAEEPQTVSRPTDTVHSSKNSNPNDGVQLQPKVAYVATPTLEVEKVESLPAPPADSSSPTDKKRKAESPYADDDSSPTKRHKANILNHPSTATQDFQTQVQGSHPNHAEISGNDHVQAPVNPVPKSSHITSPERPYPRNLPKTVRNRPENARVFIGNLASEYTDVHEIIRIFHKYGNLIEEPVLRRSFGFVQYSSAEEASRAVAQEQGRIIGGIAIDLSIADNREVKRGTHIQNNTPYSHSAPMKTPLRGRSRAEREPDRGRKRRRSLSPASAARKGGVHPPQYGRRRPDPKNGIYLRILCMSPTAKAYARHCESTFTNMTGLAADVLHIVAAGLGEALGKAMRDVIPYVMVVASKDVEDGTCTIRTLEKTGYEKSGRGNGVIPLREAVEVCLIERGVIAPQGMGNEMPMPVPPVGMQSGGQWGPHGNHSMGNMHSGKPAWMAGGRPPPAINPRMGPPSGVPPSQMMGGMPAPGGYAPYQAPLPSGPHRPDQNYPRGGGPPPQPGYEGYDYNNSNQLPAHGSGYAPGPMNPNAGSGGRERYGGEYDPATVMPHRGGNAGYGSNWGKESQPMGRNEMYGNERRAQPAITRDRNGFHTVPPAQMYQSGPMQTMDRSGQAQNQASSMYGGMPGTNYDSRQGAYQQNTYQQYGGPPDANISQGMGGNMHHGINSGGMQHSNGANGMPMSGNGNNMRHTGGDVGMGVASDRYPGTYNNATYGGQMMGGNGNVGVGQNSNGYGPRVDRGMDRGGGANSYMGRGDMGRSDNGGASMGMNMPRQGSNGPGGNQSGGPAGPAGTVDIGKLTNLISAFQQKQAAAQAQHGHSGQNRGAQAGGRPPHMGYSGQQHQAPAPQQQYGPGPRHGGQQYGSNQMGGPYGAPQQSYPYGAPAPGGQHGAPMSGMGRQQQGYYR